MSHFEITGGVALRGEVRCGGAKNAALPIMAAAILASEPVQLERVPRVGDVRTQARLLRRLGLQVVWEGEDSILIRPASGASAGLPSSAAGEPQGSARQEDRHSCLSKTSSLTHKMTDRNVCPPGNAVLLSSAEGTVGQANRGTPDTTIDAFVRRMRAGFCVLGPLLARRGHAIVPLPGGCNLGDRPVDLHLKGLAALGADIRFEHGYVVATARQLIGTKIDLAGPNGPTVTGTANVMSAAVLAKGVTVIEGAAVEPEIVDLGEFLVKLGAKIEGVGTGTIRIEGVEQLGGATHRLIPDRIEAATLLAAAAITGGSITVAGVVPKHLQAVLELLSAAGATIHVEADRVTLSATGRLRATNLVAQPYPGVPTDFQPQWTSLMALADGVSRIEDRVFPARFLHVAELNRLGAKIARGQGVATVTGAEHLSGASVTAHDLRGSAALVLAGLAAEGRTVLGPLHHLDRGYEGLDDKLRRLGAKIDRML